MKDQNDQKSMEKCGIGKDTEEKNFLENSESIKRAAISPRGFAFRVTNARSKDIEKSTSWILGAFHVYAKDSLSNRSMEGNKKIK